MSIKDDTDEESYQEPQLVEVIGEQDWFLRSILENVIGLGVDMGVTFTVGGSIVSGMLISGRKYFELLGDGLAASSKSGDDIQAILGETWRQNTAIYDKPEDAGDDWRAPPLGYVHLREARYYVPGQDPIPTNAGLLWRGKLSSIDGFSLGNFSTGG